MDFRRKIYGLCGNFFWNISIKQISNRWLEKLAGPKNIDDIAVMNPDYFETFCTVLWGKHGYPNVYRTPRVGDGGIDIVAIKDMNGVLIQCKSSSCIDQELGWDAVKEVVGGTAAYAAQHPGISFRKIAVTNQRFNGTARLGIRLCLTMWSLPTKKF